MKSGLAPLYKLLDEFVKLIPSHKDTKRGRSRALQVKGALIVVGVLVAATIGDELVYVGVAIALMGLILPIPEMRKRTWRARLKSAQFTHKQSTTAASVTFDQRRIAIQIDGKVDRRVLVNKGNHRIEEGASNGRQLLVVKGKVDRKKEHVWLLGDSSSEEETYAADDVFKPVYLTSAQLKEIAAALDSQ